MKENELRASVQYNDVKGTIAADWGDQRGFWEFASDFGIDTDQYFPFGVNVYIGESGKAFVSILAVSTTLGGNFDAIQEYINEKGTLPYTSFRVDAQLEDLLRYIKRLDFVLLNRWQGIQGYEPGEYDAD